MMNEGQVRYAEVGVKGDCQFITRSMFTMISL
jgi:hypothetical protein